MVNVFIHPNVDAYKARVVSGEVVSLKIESDRGDITICGDRASAETFHLIADIFNDAFAKKPEDHNASVEASLRYLSV